MMEGGVKKMDDTLSSFDSVKAMIQDSVITHISYTSLSGFLFRIDSNVSSFLGLNELGTQFSQPIHSLVLKIALVVKSKHHKVRLPNLEIHPMHAKKIIELLDEFSTECAVQQTIYEKTLAPRGKPICLSVVDFSYFEQKDSKEFLKLLVSKTTDPVALKMLKYLETHVSSDVHLAMITMQLADQFVTLKSLQEEHEYDPTDNIVEQVCLRSLAQTFILFVKMKYINYDCHKGNILANNHESFLIDFGRVLDIHNLTDESFKETYNILADLCGTVSYDDDWENVKHLTITDLYVNKAKDVPLVVERLRRLLLFLTRVDQAYNNQHFNLIKPQNYALFKFIFDGRSKKHQDAKLEKIIPMIREFTETPIKAVNAISRDAIRTMTKNGRIFSLNTTDLTIYKRKMSATPDTEAVVASRGTKRNRKTADLKTPSSATNRTRKTVVDTFEKDWFLQEPIDHSITWTKI